tara:strand:- start:14044 stop:14616 length:573 start_codon:yes stop_codon:yes gene_type:complete
MIPSILQSVKDKGHVIFESGQYNLNIIGVRTSDMTPNVFNDWIYIVYKDETDQWVELRYQITTDPGLYYLKNPMRVTGTAILKAGQYRSSHKLGLHRSQYDALVQRGKVTIYRDRNKDDVFDMDANTEVSGYFGINIHRSNPNRESTQVDRWSAGCQVFANPNEYGMFIDLCKRSSERWGDSFTYTLIEQ